jgi:uncharacterized membrane protein YfhO
VTEQQADLANGRASATIVAHEPGVAVLSASYDPGWTATIDGRPATTVMVAPALVAIRVPSGVHHVAFHYSGFPYYPQLFLLAGATLLGLAIRQVRVFRNRPRSKQPLD